MLKTQSSHSQVSIKSQKSAHNIRSKYSYLSKKSSHRSIFHSPSKTQSKSFHQFSTKSFSLKSTPTITMTDQQHQEHKKCTKPILQFDPELLQHYDNIIFDMDGVVWHAHEFIPGIVDTLNQLQSVHNKKIFFCTNNSTQHRSTYYPHFNKVQLNIPHNHLYTSASTAASLVFNNVFNNKIPTPNDPTYTNKTLVIGQEGLLREFKDLGIWDHIVTLSELRTSATTNLHAMRTYELDPNIKTVISGLQTDFSWGDCAIATMIIRENNADFFATNKDITFPASPTRLLPGAGSVVTMIQATSGKEAIAVGKPTRYMLDAIVRDHNIDLSRTLMVGDRLDTDIAFGNTFGMDTLLVFTGITNKEKYNEIETIIPYTNDAATIYFTEKIQLNKDSDKNVKLMNHQDHFYNHIQTAKPTFWADNINWLLQSINTEKE